MTAVLELDFRTPPGAEAALQIWAHAAIVPALEAAAGLRTLDAYEADKVDDPYLDDGTGPALMLMAHFADAAALNAAVAGSALAAALDIAACPVAGAALKAEAYDFVPYAVAGQSRPAPMTAPFSYVVRYCRPAEDEKKFVTFYLANHPQILGKFPRIRNVMCYVPIPWRAPAGIGRWNYMLGNEVVFDSAADLQASLKSEVRHEARRDFNSFPKFSGANTHYAMQRKRLIG